MTSRGMDSTLVWIDASSWKYNTRTGSTLVGSQHEIMELMQHNVIMRYLIKVMDEMDLNLRISNFSAALGTNISYSVLKSSNTFFASANLYLLTCIADHLIKKCINENENFGESYC